MRSTRRALLLPVLIASAALIATAAWAQDWPTWRHDSSRSGITDSHLDTPLALRWTYVPRHAPRPAWPEPGRELNRMAFDYAPQVAVGDGLVFFGSTADHRVHALDLATGEPRWSFFTGGPVRFSPVVSDGRVYVASDNGFLYCLAAADGSLQWRFYGGPAQEMVMGNEQLVSRHPLRSGVVVEDGVVYFTAGMWPSDGVFVYALDAADGSVLWRNDTSGRLYLRHPHPPSMAMSGVAPQGYLVVDDDQLFVPTGRNVPAAFDRQTGQLQYYHPGPQRWADRWGGTWVFTASDMVFCWRSRPGPDIDVEMGEHEPWPKDGMAGMKAESGEIVWEFIGKLHAVLRDSTLYASGGGSISAHDFQALLSGEEPEKCRKWQTEHGRAYSLIMADETLVAGGRDEVTAVAAADGRVLWHGEVEGQVRGLAAADGALVASLDDGRVLCYAPQAETAGEPASIEPEPATTPDAYAAGGDAGERAERILDRTGVTEGYCVQLGADAGLAFELAKRSDLRIWCVEADPERVALARRALEAAGLYGVRVTVHEGSPSDLGYPQYLADLVIVGQGIAGESPTVHRLLKPGGGVACLATSGAVVARRAPLQGAGQWTHQYANAGRTGASDDSAVRVPVRMQWFGKPGPAMMVTRHWRGPAPLCVDARLFVIGQFRITAVDAYNGRELWVRDLPKAGRFPVSTEGGNAAADEAAVYVAVEDHCLRLDMATGETVTTYEMPGGEGDEALWDYIGLDHDLLLGTSDGGLLFALDKETGQPRWTYEAQFGVHHDSVAVGEGGVFLIDSPPAAELDKLRRRGQPTRGLSKLVRLDLQSGETVWATPSILPRRDLRLSQGVLLATGGGRMSAYSAETGDILSWGDVAMQRFPVVVGDTIYGQPHAYNLTTGERLERVHPLTGEMVPWSMHRSYGCGSVSGAPNLLAFRSSTLGFYDLADDSGIHNYGAIRAGCYVNAIMAAGLVLMPPGDAGCTCSYNFQTTVALAPTQRQEEWAVFATGGETTPVRHAHLNLGAPGDRRDEDGRLWLGVPRPAGLAVPLEVKLAEDGGYYHHNADQVEIAATDRPWIYATGVEGVETLTLTLEREEPATYHVRLHFAEPSGAGAGERVFDVRVGQQTVLAGVDVAAEAGGGMAALVREFDVEARHAMSIEFVRRASQTQPPILSAIEVEEQ